MFGNYSMNINLKNDIKQEQFFCIKYAGYFLLNKTALTFIFN